jgi:uncharacterized cupredoxin-like copper-binding protein
MAAHVVSPLIAVLTLAVAACGNSSSAEKSPDQSSAKQDTASQTGASGSATHVTGGRTTVSMTDFEFRPKALSASAGRLRVTARNDGAAPHELVVIRTPKAPNALATRSGQASEAGAFGEIAEQKPGHRASHTFNLEPGRYVYICNVPGHYKAGMYGTLTVR